MFSKLKQSLLDQNIDLESIISNIDFELLKQKSEASIRSIFQSLDDATKDEIYVWVSEVRKIKNDTSLKESEKEAKLKELKTSDTILSFLKSLIDVLANKVPIQNKELLKAGIAGVGIAASVLNIEISGIALLVLSQALPKFLLSQKFDEFADFIEKELAL